jgi:hypothetical protein
MKYALQPLLSNLVGATFGELYCDDDERSEPF